MNIDQKRFDQFRVNVLILFTPEILSQPLLKSCFRLSSTANSALGGGEVHISDTRTHIKSGAAY